MSPTLHLNIAQLLFVQGDVDRARRELPPLESLADDGKLERHFYELAHLSADSRSVASAMKSLLMDGARTTWDFTLNIEVVRRQDEDRARVLGEVALSLATGSTAVLDRLQAEMPS